MDYTPAPPEMDPPTAQPDLAPEPRAELPEGLEPEALEPEGLEPEGLEPEALEFGAIDPEAIEPGATDTEGMELEALEPEALELEGKEEGWGDAPAGTASPVSSAQPWPQPSRSGAQQGSQQAPQPLGRPPLPPPGAQQGRQGGQQAPQPLGRQPLPPPGAQQGRQSGHQSGHQSTHQSGQQVPHSSGHQAGHTRALHHDKLLAYGRALQFGEFVARSGQGPEGSARRRLLRTRYAETRLGPAIQLAAAILPDTLHILALVSEEDPDTLAVLPIVARLAAGGPHIELRILCDDDDLTPLSVLAPDLDPPALLEEWDLPQFLCFDEEWYLQAQWGPRPAAAEGQVETWLAAHPEYEQLAEDETPAGHDRYMALVEQLGYEMRVWYNSGLTARALDEWLELLRAWQGEEAAAEAAEGAGPAAGAHARA